MNKNTDSKKTQGRIFDLTDFDVVRSDNSESYCVLQKYFNTGDEALEFALNLQEYVVDAINEGTMIFHGFLNFLPYACGYLPVVNFKLPSCAAYDEDGNYDEDEDFGTNFEMSCCIINMGSYRNGRVELTLYYVELPDEINEVETEEIKTINTFFA